MVRKHRDRLVFENPGTIRVGKEKMLEGGLSDPRNSVIIKMFSMLHIGERAGSGMNRIISAWSAAGYENPMIEEHIGNIERTTLTLPLVYVDKGTRKTYGGTQKSTQKIGPADISEGKSTPKGVPRKKGTQKNDMEFSRTATAILNAIIVQPTITREMLADLLNVSDSTIKKHLKRFKDLGLIERIGPDNGGYWEVKK